jgi:hypothetical protein
MGFLNTNIAITQQLIQTARTLEVEWRQVLQESMSTGAKKDESSTGRVWAAGFHHVTAHSHLAGVLRLMNHLFNFTTFFSGYGGYRGTTVLCFVYRLIQAKVHKKVNVHATYCNEHPANYLKHLTRYASLYDTQNVHL